MFGLQVVSGATQPAASPAKRDAGTGEEARGRYAANATMHALPAIVTNLASPDRTWIRLEASLVLEDETSEVKALTAAVTEDITGYLRTLSLPLIEGASGLLHLREDLNDRVRIRSGGKVRDIIVHTLIVE